MIELLKALAALVIVLGATVLIAPRWAFDYLRRNYERNFIYWLAIGSRLVIGCLMVGLAGVSKFPVTIKIMGILLLGVALTLALIGRGGFRKVIARVLNMGSAIGRVGGLLGMAFGLFVVYAFS
ncbi:MAG: hypothetical protein AAF404_07645 [Pseudomonadota bacterium]